MDSTKPASCLEKDLIQGTTLGRKGTGRLRTSWLAVMWSDTGGLRTRPVSDQHDRSWSWSCRSDVVKHGLVTLVVIIILKDAATFQVLFIVSLFCNWNITMVEINSGVNLLRNIMKACKQNTVELHLLLYIYSKCNMIRHLQTWSWSYYFGLVSSGLGLSVGLKYLVLFTSKLGLEWHCRRQYER